MRRGLPIIAALVAAAWSVPGATQVASASAKASEITGKMVAAGAAFGTLALVIIGYFFMAGHGDRQTLALWAAGLAVVLCATSITALLT